MVVAPTNYSLIDNADEMLEMFIHLNGALARGSRIRLDMSKIERLTMDAILYTLSRLQYYENLNDGIQVQGSFPADRVCRDLLLDSGFLKYFASSISKKPDVNTLSIEDGEIVDNQIAYSVVKFAELHLGDLGHEARNSLYRILIECMKNTRQHAYEPKTFAPKWYMIARHDPVTHLLSFAFLDSGLGIATTAKKRYKEKVHEIIAGLALGQINGPEDTPIIESALRGEFRSSTGEPHRGNGLPQLDLIDREKVIQNLVIVSNKGYVGYDHYARKVLDDPFHGTLICWDFVGKDR